MKTRANKVTTVQTKPIGVPITNEEKYERLRIMNPKLDNLKDAFGLEIEL